MTRPVALFQLDPADLDKLDPVPRDDEYEPFLFVRQDDPLELVPSPPPPGLDDLDGVGPASAGRRLKDRAGLGRGRDEMPGLWVKGVGAEVTAGGAGLAAGGRKDERGRGGGPDGITAIVVRVGV
jgi:hypothetical protein